MQNHLPTRRPSRTRWSRARSQLPVSHPTDNDFFNHIMQGDCGCFERFASVQRACTGPLARIEVHEDFTVAKPVKRGPPG